MDIQAKQSTPYPLPNTPPKPCFTARSGVISLLALGILSGAVAIYAANFLVALPLTIVTLTIGSGVVSLVSFIAAGCLGLCNKENVSPHREVENLTPSAPLAIDLEPVMASAHIETLDQLVTRLQSGGFSFASCNKEYILKIKQDLAASGQEEILFQAALKDPSMGILRFKDLGLYEETKKATILEAQIEHLTSNPLDFFSFFARNRGSSLEDHRIKDAFCKLPYREIFLNPNIALLPGDFIGAFKGWVNVQVHGLSFSQFIQFHRTPEALTLLTKENALLYRAGFLEAISAKKMEVLNQPVLDFIKDPLPSLAAGMWLLEDNSQMLETLRGLQVDLQAKHRQMLLKKFKLETLSQEFTTICRNHAELSDNLKTSLQYVEDRFTGEELHLRKSSQDGETQMQLLYQEQLAQDNAAFEAKPAVKNFREAENNLKQLEDDLKSTCKELETTKAQILKLEGEMRQIEAKLGTLKAAKDSRESRIEEQRAIISRETSKKEEEKKATKGFASASSILSHSHTASSEIKKAEGTIRAIEKEEAQIEALAAELARLLQELSIESQKTTELTCRKERLEIEITSATNRKEEKTGAYLAEKSTFDNKIQAKTQKLTKAIALQKQELDKKLAALSKEKTRHTNSTKTDSIQDCTKTIWHQLNTVFIPAYNALFSS